MLIAHRWWIHIPKKKQLNSRRKLAFIDLLMRSYARLLLAFLALEAIVVSCLLASTIAELYKFEAVRTEYMIRNKIQYYDLVVGDYMYHILNWFNVLIGMWFQFGFAIDSYIHHNSMQVLVLPFFNALLTGIQIHEFLLVSAVRRCHEAIPQSIDTSLLKGLNDGYIANIKLPAECRTTVLYDLMDQTRLRISSTTLSLYKDNHNLLLNAFNLSLATVILMCLFFIIICYLAFNTYRDYGWIIYRINGANIQKRNTLTRFHLFMLALKLNIYFSLCDAFVYLFTIVNNLVFDPEVVRQTFETDAADLTAGGYASNILMIVSSAWCLLSALLFYFVGIHAIRRRKFCLMVLLLVVYLVQVFIEGRACLYWLAVYVPSAEPIQKSYYIYWGVIYAIEMAFDGFIVVMGCWVLYDFGNGLADMVNDMFDNKPWVVVKKPDHLNVKKERFVVE